MKLLFSLLLLLFSFSSVHAQEAFTPAEQAGVIDAVVDFLKNQHEEAPLFNMSINVSPRNPAPDSVITAQVKSFSANLQQETIVWTIDGREQARGKGIVSQEVTVGGEGESTTIVVSVILSEKNVKSESIVLRPGTVSLIWESETSVPKWYAGARLPSPGSMVRVKAFPELQFGNGKLDPETLTYSWSLDGRPMRSVSGVGKSLFVFKTANLSSKKHSVSVLVSSPSGQVRGSVSTTIPIFEPQIYFYESKPLIGTLFNRSLDNTAILSNEDTGVTLAPFFFSGEEENLIEYEWNVGNKRLDNSFRNVRTILLSSQNSNFTETISVVARHTTNIFQNAQKAIQISINN